MHSSDTVREVSLKHIANQINIYSRMSLQAVNQLFEKHNDAIKLLNDLYKSIDQADIRKNIDAKGLDSFVDSCAQKAGMTGLTSGIAGPISMFVGIPVDIINNFSQQFRVTSGIFYHKKMRSPNDFEEFFQIVGLSLGVEVSRVMTNQVVKVIINKIALRMAFGSVGKVVPILGGVLGAGANYLFIKGIAKAVQNLDF